MTARRHPLWLLVLPAFLACSSQPQGGGDTADASPVDIDAPTVDVDARPCVSSEVAEFPQGAFGSPAAMNRSECRAGALAGIDLDGMWHVVDLDDQSAFGRGPMRVTHSCDDGVATQSGSLELSSWDLSSLSDDDFFVRNESGGSSWTRVRTYNFCDIDESGQLRGRHGTCLYYNGDEFCSETRIVASRFGRMEGEAIGEGLTLVSQYSGPENAPWGYDFTANIDVHKGLAYVARREDGLRIVDVSTPASPVEVGHFPAQNEYLNEVHVLEYQDRIYALLASSERGAVIVDVTEPASAQLVAVAPLDPGLSSGIHRMGLDVREDGRTRIYSSDSGSPFVGIWDVTNPAQPVFLGRYQVPVSGARVHAASGAGDMLYASAKTEGLHVADISDPRNPVSLGVFSKDPQYSHHSWPLTVSGPGGDRAIVLHGDEGYNAHLEVVDADPLSPTFMQLLGELSLRPSVSIHNFVVVGERAYVSHYQDGVRVVDISDPSNPTQVAYYNTWDADVAPGVFFEGATDIEVDVDGLIYVADSPGGMFILREQ